MAINKSIKTVSQEIEPVQTTINVPKYVWKAVKNAATDERVSAQAIWIRAACRLFDLPEPEPKDVAA